MNSVIQKIPKLFLPPLVYKLIKKVFQKDIKWYGDFKSWSEAEKRCMGFDQQNILENVKNALLKVKNGEAAAERDSVIFDKIQYSWPVLSSLLFVAGKNEGRLNVLDFGGSLGSTYFQNKIILDQLGDIQWNIVEQKHFVDCGKQYFENSNIRFYNKIEDCLIENKINVIIFSGVLQYLEDPFAYCKLLLEKNISYIIIDRTCFQFNKNRKNNRLTIQSTPPSIYNATFPCWAFNEELFLSWFKGNYNLLYDFDSPFEPVIHINFRTQIKFKGFFFQKK